MPGVRKKLLGIATVLTVATESIGAVLMGWIVLINLVQVFFRYFVGSPLGWTEEAMRYSVVWLTFLLAGAVLFRGEQMMLDLFGDALSVRLRRIQSILILLAVSAFCLILVVYGWPLAVRNASQHSPTAQIPMIIPYMSVVVGGALTFIKAICLLIAAPERVMGDIDAR